MTTIKDKEMPAEKAKNTNKETYEKGRLVVEGKTKKVFELEGNPSAVILVSGNVVTAGDGAKRSEAEGKGELSTTTTCNVFQLLEQCGIRTAFHKQISATEFIADNCDMIDLEVVVRREGHGSHLKRNPQDKQGVYFNKLRVEFYLKTTDKKWGDLELPKDDPLIRFVYGNKDPNTHVREIAAVELYRPDKPIATQKPFHTFDHFPFKWDQKVLENIEDTARNVFLILERAWWLEEYRLVDFKIEFGFNSDRKLVLADVIDGDSWRLVRGNSYHDKQIFRDGGSSLDFIKKYVFVAEATKHFRLPCQQIILWTGSKNDDISPFEKGFDDYFKLPDCELIYHTCSIHKQPLKGLIDIDALVQGTYDRDVGCVNTVVIAYVGMSNGAGPILSAHTHVPVITCSPSVKDFAPDIWSSLRMPSGVPLMTVLSPKNALLAAFQILAIRSPRIYALLRRKIEDRL